MSRTTTAFAIALLAFLYAAAPTSANVIPWKGPGWYVRGGNMAEGLYGGPFANRDECRAKASELNKRYPSNLNVRKFYCAYHRSEEETDAIPRHLEDLQRLALDGDQEAALQVAWHYDKFGSAEETIKWQTIAAENGALVAMVNLSMVLWGTQKSENCRRAKFWLRRASAAAKSEADRLDTQTRVRDMAAEFDRCISKSGKRRYPRP